MKIEKNKKEDILSISKWKKGIEISTKQEKSTKDNLSNELHLFKKLAGEYLHRKSPKKKKEIEDLYVSLNEKVLPDSMEKISTDMMYDLVK
ncbi:hypothetical protein CVD28_02720 [Bacillus sp. M6-12]|uniref:hypothetical protein n=1 Tax=Bacillus sp. M6-12 TaxID=2054166 RepID=UPI000C78FECF|nr:hypothetical protein [Bacillus sp. M6-12]PLS19345.1 hypothetical protein CVD28_02720 [Bacillus sp. M6-12]